MTDQSKMSGFYTSDIIVISLLLMMIQIFEQSFSTCGTSKPYTFTNYTVIMEHPCTNAHGPNIQFSRQTWACVG